MRGTLLLTSNQVKTLSRDVDPFIASWHDDVSHLAGWRHNYFCQDDGALLTFDPASPHRHVCPECGRVYESVATDNAWVTIFRNLTLDHLRQAMFLYQATATPKYLDFCKRVLNFYASHYSQFPIHVKDVVVDYQPYESLRAEAKPDDPVVMFDNWALDDGKVEVVGPGKIMGQGLSEAIALIKLAFVFQNLRDHFDQSEAQLIVDQLFLPARDFLDQQQFAIHNITLWREAAIQVLNIVCGQPVDFERRLGIYDHLTKGVTNAGLWYEGSMHYHFYVLEALTDLAYFCTQGEIEAPKLRDGIEQMLSVPCQLAFANGDLPNPNDGWPNINLLTYVQQYEMAALAYPKDEQIQALYAMVLNSSKSRVPVPLEQDRYFGKHSIIGQAYNLFPSHVSYEPRHQNQLLDGSKLAVLAAGDWQAFIKYGCLTLSHAHYDPLNFELAFGNHHLVKDLSNAGYGSGLNERWYNTTLGHNSLIINGALNNNRSYHAEVTQILNGYKAVSADAFPDSVIERQFTLTVHGLVIRNKAVAPANGQTALVQHLEIGMDKMATQAKLSAIPLSGVAEFALDRSFVKKAYQVATTNHQALFQFPEFQFTLSWENEAKLYLLVSVGNPVEQPRLSWLLCSGDHLNATIKIG